MQGGIIARQYCINGRGMSNQTLASRPDPHPTAESDCATSKCSSADMAASGSAVAGIWREDVPVFERM
jgi:hypothetical protein